MFSYADGMTMSSKKDAIVNMGGFIGFRDEELFRQASTFNIIYEGFITYGGMSGRDMNALAQGLYEGTEFAYLESRVNQVAFLGSKMKEYGIPVLEPLADMQYLLMQKSSFLIFQKKNSRHRHLHLSFIPKEELEELR